MYCHYTQNPSVNYLAYENEGKEATAVAWAACEISSAPFWSILPFEARESHCLSHAYQ